MNYILFNHHPRWIRFSINPLPLFLVATLALTSHGESNRPNVVLVLIDDLGAEAVGCYGGESYSTPNLDALAQAGMRYDNAYSMPACMVSRATLLTGRYAFRSNLPFNDTPFVRRESWGAGEITFANVLRDAGYATGISGKWQLCEHAKYPNHLSELGFDRQNAWAWWRDDVTLRRYWGPSFFRDKQFVTEPDDVYGPDRFCDWTIEFMRTQAAAGRPFVAYYPMVLIHHPFPQTPDNIDEPQPGWRPEDNFDEHPRFKFSKTNFDAMIAYADKLIGRIAGAIDELEIAENTLLIVTADNGTIPRIESRYRGQMVRGGKMRLNEAGSRVPFIAVWKGKIAAGSVNDALVDFSDIAPTLCDLTGTEMPKDRVIDGQSFLPQLLGKPNAPEREWVFSRYRARSFVRGPHYRLSNDGRFHDMTDRYNPRLVSSETSNDPPALSDQEAAALTKLRSAFASLDHPVGPDAGPPPRQRGIDQL